MRQRPQSARTASSSHPNTARPLASSHTLSQSTATIASAASASTHPHGPHPLSHTSPIEDSSLILSKLGESATPSTLDHPLEDLYPCENFNMVSPGIYRSAFPKKKNFAFLKSLGLKSILTLILEDYPEVNTRFLDDHGITLFQFGVPGNKEPFVDIPEDAICSALSVMMDRRNHPLLIHCNKGKHRTGCLVGCLRKIQHWSFTSICEEYRRFSYPKSRSMDQQFIELFDIRHVVVDIRWIPSWPEIANGLHHVQVVEGGGGGEEKEEVGDVSCDQEMSVDVLD